jgi:hypothetical protein
VTPYLKNKLKAKGSGYGQALTSQDKIQSPLLKIKNKIK